MGSVAHTQFSERLGEIELLRKIAALSINEFDAAGNLSKVNALCRSSFVLLVAHIQGYVEDIGEEITIGLCKGACAKSAVAEKFYFYLSQDLLKGLRDNPNPDSMVRQVRGLVERDWELWRTDQPFNGAMSYQRFKDGFGNPTLKEIAGYLSRFGIDDLTDALRQRLKADFAAIENMMDTLLRMRVRIAHGDLAATPGAGDVDAAMSLSAKLVDNIDAVVLAWAQQWGCPIGPA